MGHAHHGNKTGRRVIKLAPGSKLSPRAETSQAMVLELLQGKVQLNEHALAILELCDGSRDRDRVVVDAMLRSPGLMHAADIVQFLDAALARRWITEGR
jgi:Coenzyme PQQ synthesis protein D (PqqD)